MNSVMERWIGSCRRGLPDRTVAWNQRLWVPKTLPQPLTWCLVVDEGRSD
jgi:hypothetical protein